MNLKILILCILLPMITSCGSNLKYYGKLCGTIIDQETSKPIEGVVIFALWQTGNWTDSRYSFTRPSKVAEVVTDRHGMFCLNGQGFAFFPHEPSIEVFKSGYSNIADPFYPNLKDLNYYKDSVSWNGNHVTIKLKKLSIKERHNRRSSGTTYNTSKHMLDKSDFKKDMELFNKECEKEDAEVQLYRETLREGRPIYGKPPSKALQY